MFSDLFKHKTKPNITLKWYLIHIPLSFSENNTFSTRQSEHIQNKELPEQTTQPYYWKGPRMHTMTSIMESIEYKLLVQQHVFRLYMFFMQSQCSKVKLLYLSYFIALVSLQSRKTSENLWFFYVLSKYRKRPVALNGYWSFSLSIIITSNLNCSRPEP